MGLDWTYVAIMSLAIAAGLALYRVTREPLSLVWWQKAGIALGAFCGGMIGAKLPFLLSDLTALADGTAWLASGKTIVSGLVGGYVGVQVAEWSLGLRITLCDSFAAPVAIAVAIGRLGCFHAGCCYGTVTGLPWGVDFGDGQLRHPTQLYEAAFHLAAAVILFQLLRRDRLRGQHIRLYFASYFLYRFGTEFIRPEPVLWAGLTGYQLASLFLATVLIIWGFPCCESKWTLRRQILRRVIPRIDDAAWKPLKETYTICPQCLNRVPGVVLQHKGRVFMRRMCPDHGLTVGLVSSDRRHYYLRDEVPHPPPDDSVSGCGAPEHKACVVLLELTDACNLQCPVCYANSPSGRHRSYGQLCEELTDYVDAHGSLDILQLSGGEPLIHPDILGIVDFAQSLPIDHVMINTNGLELLRQRGLAAELRARLPHLELSLQFDGLDARTSESLRGVDLSSEKRAMIALLKEYNLPATLVCTVARGVNELALGELVRLAVATRQVRGITFQPAIWSGRFDAGRDPLDRVTLADVIRDLVRQSGGLLDEDDFKPLPCSDPNCCSFTYLLRRAHGCDVPLTRLTRYEDHIEQLADRMNFDVTDARSCCGVPLSPEDVLRIVVKPFMDVFTYDQDRIDECCVRVIQPGGAAVSFCEYNALIRGRQDNRQADHLAGAALNETAD